MDKTLNKTMDGGLQMDPPKDTYQVHLRRTDLETDDHIRKPKKIFTDHQTPDEHLNATYWG
jgi:hypothetical protein